MRIARVQGYRNRQALVKVCFTLIVLIFTYRAFTVSDIQANDITLKTKASKNSEFSLVDKSMRGNILDRNDNILALNKNSYNVLAAVSYTHLTLPTTPYV